MSRDKGAVQTAGLDKGAVQSAAATASAALAGSVTSSINEDDVVAGTETIILTLTGDTFVTGTTSEDGIAGGTASDVTPATGFGWNDEVQLILDNADVAISTTTVADDTATITLPAFVNYDTDETETITVTIPAASLTGGVEIIATPTFTVDAVAAGATVPVLDEGMLVGGFQELTGGL